jgi:hypothetical protein
MSDYYDTRGQLWQQAVVNHYYAFDANAWHAGTSFYHDLNSGRLCGLQPVPGAPPGSRLEQGQYDCAMFTPEAARNAGN